MIGMFRRLKDIIGRVEGTRRKNRKEIQQTLATEPQLDYNLR